MIDSPDISRMRMSPGSDGARVTSPGPRAAVKVFWKKDSWVSMLRAREASRPPCIFVWMSMVPDIDTMAPDSALKVSPWSRATRASVKAGPCSVVACMAVS